MTENRVEQEEFNRKVGNVWSWKGSFIAFLIILFTGIMLFFFGDKNAETIENENVIEGLKIQK